jgi:hypothetical protein
MERPEHHRHGSVEMAPQWSRFIGNKESDVASAFFSKENKSRIHRMIIKAVYDRTEGQISLSQQSDSEVHVVMVRTIQSEYNLHLGIRQLNQQVVRFCADNIMQNIGFYMQYLRDMNEGPKRTEYDRLRAGEGDGADILLRPRNTRESRETAFKRVL